MQNTTSNSKLSLVVLFVILAAVGVAAGLWAGKALFGGKSAPSPDELAQLNATALPESRPLKPFKLRDQNDQAFDLSRLKDHWTLIFFGYTHCPDVCPATLAIMAQAHKLLAETPEDLQATQFVFVSVDPQRDTTDQLKSYVGYFNPTFLGVTGEAGEIDRLTRQMGVAYAINKGDDPTRTNYTVDHSAAILLIDPSGGFRAVFSTPHSAENISVAFRRIRHYYQ